MLRKIAVAALAVVAGLFILNSTHLGSYARTAIHKARVALKKQVPLEFQLESARNEVVQLVPDMRRHITSIAQETVAVQNLREQIADMRTNLDKETKHLASLREQAGTAKVSVTGGSYRIADRMSRTLGACKRCKEELKAKEALLEAKEKALDAARERLTQWRTQKEQLEVQIAQMEAERKSLRLAQTKSNIQLDDSRLSQIKSTLADIRNQMRVQQTEADLVGSFETDGSFDKKVKNAEEISREVDSFLKDDSQADAVLADKK